MWSWAFIQRIFLSSSWVKIRSVNVVSDCHRNHSLLDHLFWSSISGTKVELNCSSNVTRVASLSARDATQSCNGGVCTSWHRSIHQLMWDIHLVGEIQLEGISASGCQEVRPHGRTSVFTGHVDETSNVSNCGFLRAGRLYVPQVSKFPPGRLGRGDFDLPGCSSGPSGDIFRLGCLSQVMAQ